MNKNKCKKLYKEFDKNESRAQESKFDNKDLEIPKGTEDPHELAEKLNENCMEYLTEEQKKRVKKELKVK